MLARIKEFFIGPPLPTTDLGEKRLNKIRALAAFSPDALSSIAYANQEIYLGLLVAWQRRPGHGLPDRHWRSPCCWWSSVFPIIRPSWHILLAAALIGGKGEPGDISTD